MLWLYTTVIGGSDTVINRLVAMGKRIYFITNNSTKTRDEFVEKAKQLRFNVGRENVISTAYLTAQYLKQRNFDKKVYVVGSSGIGQELDLVGIRHFGVGPDPMVTSVTELRDRLDIDEEVGAVVVGFDEHISYPKLIKAASYLDRPGCLFLGTNADERFPMPGCIMPGTGSLVRCIETCAERKATIIGKPENLLSEVFFKDAPIEDPQRCLMIGDRLNTDILFGNKNGYRTLLVHTGVHNTDTVQEILDSLGKTPAPANAAELENQIPEFYIERLGDLFANYD